MAKPKQKHSARANAARVISNVLRFQSSLNTVLRPQLDSLDISEKALCQQLCYGVIRWHHQLQGITDRLVKKPLRAKDSDILALLQIGLYQLRSMRLPEHAILSETVNACAALNKVWAKGLINASLRSYLRDKDALEQQLTAEQLVYAHPSWLIELIKTDWPEQWQAILEANNQQPPMMLRVNQQKMTREDYLEQLSQHDIAATVIEQTNNGIILQSPCDVKALPGFTDGLVSVQDGAAQQVAEILDIQPGQHILDACAAPGGKTCHILEIQPDNDLIAIDIDSDRLAQIKQNTDRLQLHANLISADASQTTQWWDGKLFDRILIDAPCSGTGVIRRHPDIKLLRRPTDIAALVEKQKQLLESLWPLLKTEGLLVYTTCSLLQQENEQQIMNFLLSHTDAEEISLTPGPATRRPRGYQRLPGDDGLDGFYYACLIKR